MNPEESSPAAERRIFVSHAQTIGNYAVEIAIISYEEIEKA
jgi:hypothetical protein